LLFEKKFKIILGSVDDRAPGFEQNADTLITMTVTWRHLYVTVHMRLSANVIQRLVTTSSSHCWLPKYTD